MSIIKLSLIALQLSAFETASAQSGGAPMLTDDPSVVGLGNTQINISTNTSFYSKEHDIKVLYLDVTYGLSNKVDIGVSFPVWEIEKNQYERTTTSTLGEIVAGVKWSIINERDAFVSIGVFPKIVLKKGFGIGLPLLIEKQIGCIGVVNDCGTFMDTHGYLEWHNSTLTNYKPIDNMELMAEYSIIKSAKTTGGYVNTGFRYTISNTITFIGAGGCQIFASGEDSRNRFFSTVGVQFNLDYKQQK